MWRAGFSAMAATLADDVIARPEVFWQGASMVLRAFALCLACLAGTARADIFDDLSGTFGSLTQSETTCRLNPHRTTFSADRATVRLAWAAPFTDYRGEARTEGRYTILGHDAVSITMRAEGETRLTEAGDPVVWIMRRTAGIDGYCWGRTDWPEARCIGVHVRCPEVAPSS